MAEVRRKSNVASNESAFCEMNDIQFAALIYLFFDKNDVFFLEMPGHILLILEL